MFQRLRQQAVFSGPAHVICVPGGTILGGGIGDAPILFIDPHGHSQTLGEGNRAIGRKAIISRPGHEPQSILHPHIGIVPGVRRYIGKRRGGKLLR